MLFGNHCKLIAYHSRLCQRNHVVNRPARTAVYSVLRLWARKYFCKLPENDRIALDSSACSALWLAAIARVIDRAWLASGRQGLSQGGVRQANQQQQEYARVQPKRDAGGKPHRAPQQGLIAGQALAVACLDVAGPPAVQVAAPSHHVPKTQATDVRPTSSDSPINTGVSTSRPSKNGKLNDMADSRR